MAFELRNPAAGLSLLKPTTQIDEIVVQNIEVERLFHFEEHPFKLYTGQRFLDMVESVKLNGVLNPLIVRSKGEDYEVLAGHNRLEAAKEAGLRKVPCIVKEISDEEANLVLIETNLMQRSFSELSLSEKAFIVTSYYNTLKNQGKRNDLVSDINEILANKKVASEETSEKYELNKATISRYIRLNKLTNDMKTLLDSGILKMRSGVFLSFLNQEEQEETYNYLTKNEITINMEQAEDLKRASQSGKWQKNKTLEEIFSELSDYKPKPSVKIKYDKIKTFFTDTQTEAEIVEEIVKALEFYREKNNS
ncbi:MAG: ParB N-terminal domain-containing protein [Defluviitaleaceae bacterium]|nr:ParB N-terminal domain-containing protein [Defluviitaleaceae bacterium]